MSLDRSRSGGDLTGIWKSGEHGFRDFLSPFALGMKREAVGATVSICREPTP